MTYIPTPFMWDPFCNCGLPVPAGFLFGYFEHAHGASSLASHRFVRSNSNRYMSWLLCKDALCMITHLSRFNLLVS